MAHIFRERTQGQSKRHTIMIPNTNTITEHPLSSPFDDPEFTLFDPELRETVYEIFVRACRSSGSRPLTYIPQSDRIEQSSSTILTSTPSLQRSLTSMGASKVKKALGLKSPSLKKCNSVSQEGQNSGSSVGAKAAKRAASIGELMRVQLRVSEQTDTRIRRALLRIVVFKLWERKWLTKVGLE